MYFNKYIDIQKNKISFQITDKGKFAPMLEKYPVKASIGNNKKKKRRISLFHKNVEFMLFDIIDNRFCNFVHYKVIKEPK